MDSAAAVWKELTVGFEAEKDASSSSSQEEELWIEVSLGAPNAVLAPHFDSILTLLEGFVLYPYKTFIQYLRVQYRTSLSETYTGAL